jgi:hypothetical protein
MVGVSVAKKGRGKKPGRGKRWERRKAAEDARLREKEARVTREVASRALWRLNLLEYLILFAALVLALAGGALVAWVLNATTGVSFRLGWISASLLLFIIPGGTVYLRELRRGRQ